MKLLPDGLSVLFAPAAALPALRFGLLLGRVPGTAPVVVPPVFVTAKAAASAMLVSFMVISLCSDKGKTGQRRDTFLYRPSSEV